MKFADVFVVVAVVATVVMMIIPLPDFILSILLTFNITLSMVILMVAMYINNPLQFSILPSLLLIATLFRLALNISSTRLILLNGYAGEVIQSFGEFVVGKNALVGFIIFLILVIVQFIVITRGSERVAEVAARFTLDAMPGKQMSIDADLNAGVITESEARQRRIDIQKEADFYGAMDGASKFVKGDAIAGIIITIINIVGGLVSGMLLRGLDFSSAVSQYTLLTVGDGLVSQIPALLISTATGIVVTRAASESNLGSDLIKQILSQPKVLLISAGVMSGLGIIPGLPKLSFFVISGIMAFTGFSLLNAAKTDKEDVVVQQAEKQSQEYRKPENVLSLLNIDPIELEFGYALIPLADINQGGDLLDRVVMIRRQFAIDLGLIVPIVRLRDNIQLSPNEYSIKIKGVKVASGILKPDYYLAMNPGTVEDKIDGIPTVEPAFGLPATWIPEHMKDTAEEMGYTVVDVPSVIATHLTEIIKRHAHELLGRQDVQTLINNLKESYPSLVEELVPKTLSLGEVQKVLSNLLRENVPIRDLVTIFETLADYSSVTHDTDILTEYVRQALYRVITQRFITEKFINVVTLDREIEETITNSIKHTETGNFITINPEITRKIIEKLADVIRKNNIQIPLVLTSPVVRLYFRRLIENHLPNVIVLSYNELDPKLEVHSVGMVEL
jgi:flagellar biosynthesis protein FlhA